MEPVNGKTVIPESLDALAQRLAVAKDAKDRATRDVNELEAQIVQAVGHKVEGSTTISGALFKVTTTGRVTRSVDESEAKRLYLEGEIPEAIYNRLFDWRPKLNLAELRFVENNEPEIFAKLARAVTSKPSKTGVTIKPI